MKMTKFVHQAGLISKLVLLVGVAISAQITQAAPTLFIDQSSAISGAADTVRMARVPVRNNAGAVSYWDVTLRFTADGVTGKPILTPANIVTTVSQPLLSAAFRAGKYKDIFGNVKFSGNWTTGAITGHPIENKIKAQQITLSAYSWGTVANINTGSLNLVSCSSFSRVVGYVQVGDKLVLHGFCNGNNVESDQFTLSQCSSSNPCP